MMKSAADVEREVEASRSNLDRTVEALKDKMTPGQLFDEASRALGSTGQQVFSKFVEQAKENPMPLAVMGLGLAWLMSGSGNRSTGGYRVYEPRSFSPGDSAGASGPGIAEKAADMVSGVKDKLADATGSMGDRGRSAAQSVGAAAQSTMEKVDEYRHQAQRGFSQLLETEPLLVGAIGLAVGAAIGASLPHTDVEDRAVGPLRDKVLEKGKSLAQDAMQQAGGVAQAAYDSVKDELANPASPDAGLAERVETAARSGVQAVRDQMAQSGQGDGQDRDQGQSQGQDEAQGQGQGQGWTPGSGAAD